MMIKKEQSLLNNLSCVCFSAQTLSNPTSSVIPQSIAVENYCFTTSSRDVKNLEMETFLLSLS